MRARSKYHAKLLELLFPFGTYRPNLVHTLKIELFTSGDPAGLSIHRCSRIDLSFWIDSVGLPKKFLRTPPSTPWHLPPPAWQPEPDGIHLSVRQAATGAAGSIGRCRWIERGLQK